MYFQRPTVFSIEENFWFLLMDIKLFISKVKTSYYEVKRIRAERRIKELNLISFIREISK